MLLIIAVVGTTVAPWQLFFQQSYVIDKRITPRFIQYERADLWIGIVFVTVGAVALMGVAAATFAGHPEFAQFTDAGGVASGLEKYVGAVPAVLFALVLLDACIIGAAAVSLSTAYANRRCAGSAPLAAPQADRSKGVLCGVLRLDCTGGGIGPYAGHTARLIDERCPDPRRRAAAECHGVPAATLQRRGGTQSLG
jgi:Mn2+/Fe2+ NRAMP family transporter